MLCRAGCGRLTYCTSPGPRRGRSSRRSPAVGGPVGPNWATYGGNLASHRYSPLDQINKDNFRNLRIAWRLKTDFLGPTPDNLYSATPLYVNGVLYTTAGTRRAAIALNPGTEKCCGCIARTKGRVVMRLHGGARAAV